jgi:hypothetical protein
VENAQLASLSSLTALFERHAIDYWLFGGWAVDFHTRSVTRPHDDLDLAVWQQDHARISSLLQAEGWRHAPEPGEDGFTGYTRGDVRLELAFLARDDDGEIYTPLHQGGRGSWPAGTFEDEVAELTGVRARIVTLSGLKADKSAKRDDPLVAAKDRADLTTLDRLS